MPACGPLGLCNCLVSTLQCHAGLSAAPSVPADTVYIDFADNQLARLSAEALPVNLTALVAPNNLLTSIPRPATPLPYLADLLLGVRIGAVSAS